MLQISANNGPRLAKPATYVRISYSRASSVCDVGGAVESLEALNLDQARAILKELVGNQTLDPDILNSLNEGCMDKVIEVRFASDIRSDCSTEPTCHPVSIMIIASP